MGVMSKDYYINEARKLHSRTRGNDTEKSIVEIAADSDVSSGTSDGAWVQAWIWIPDPKKEQKDVANT